MLCGGHVFVAWQLYVAAFGATLPFTAAVVVAMTLAAGVALSHRAGSRQPLKWMVLALAACTMAVPALIHFAFVVAGAVPATVMSQSAIQWIFAIGCAAMILGPPAWLAARIGVFRSDVIEQSTGALAPFVMGLGVGLTGCVVLLAPRVGIEWIGYSCVAVSGVVFLWSWLIRQECKPAEAVVSDISSIPTSATNPHLLHTLFTWTATLAAGLQLPALERLVHQLMPATAFSAGAEGIGVLFGFAVGLRLIHRRGRSLMGFTLTAAVWSVGLMAAFPWLVDQSLWLNAHVAYPGLLILLRMALVIGCVFPVGLLAACAVSEHCRDGLAVVGIGLGYALGSVAWLPWLDVSGSLMSVAWILTSIALAAIVPRFRQVRWGWRVVSLTTCGIVLAAPLWRANYDPARAARLLFSTQVFLAQRAGFSSELLPFVDEGRLVARIEGPRTTWTVWKYRGVDYQAREDGVPRGVVSTQPDLSPQVAPAMLHAVVPLVLHERPLRVLMLGLSDGVPLSATLSFPVQRVTCCEPDAAAIRLVRDVVASASGVSPLADERVTLRRLPLELAAVTDREQYEIIVCNPGQSSLCRAAPYFTPQFLRRVAQRLTPDGIFCQRFECMDYGPEPLQIAVKSLQSAFTEVRAMEVGPGEMLFLATNSPEGLVRPDLVKRLQGPHVRRVLARGGIDWSTLLNLPAYDHETLAKIAAERGGHAGKLRNQSLVWRTPREVLRWGAKLYEVQELLTKDDRRSRLLNWVGDDGNSPEVLARLAEVVTQQKLVREYPDAHWWEYRKALRERLQTKPATTIQQVSAVGGLERLSADVDRRKAYLLALGHAVQRRQPDELDIQQLEAFQAPFDPLLNPFLHQEIADLCARTEPRDASLELRHRLQLVYHSPGFDGSVRDVIAALKLITSTPDALPDETTRFDHLNALLQLLQQRWNNRGSLPLQSARAAQRDADLSIVTAEETLAAMANLAAAAGVPAEDWQARDAVLERTLVRPLRSYRAELLTQAERNKAKLERVRQKKAAPEDELPTD